MGGICSNHADCCDGNSFLSDDNINMTYALTNWYCFENGIPPWFDNSTQTTNDTLYQKFLLDNNIKIFKPEEQKPKNYNQTTEQGFNPPNYAYDGKYYLVSLRANRNWLMGQW